MKMMFLLLLVPRAACEVVVLRRPSGRQGEGGENGRNPNNREKGTKTMQTKICAFMSKTPSTQWKWKWTRTWTWTWTWTSKWTWTWTWTGTSFRMKLPLLIIVIVCRLCVSARLYSLCPFASLLLPRLSVYLFLYVLSLFGSFLVLFGLRLSRLPASTPIWVVCVVFYFVSSSSSSASPSSYACSAPPFATLGTPPTLQITIRWTPSNKLPTI